MPDPFKFTITEQLKSLIPELESFEIEDRVLVTICSYEPVDQIQIAEQKSKLSDFDPSFGEKY